MAQASIRVKLITALLSPIVFLLLLEAGLRIGGYRYVPGSDRAVMPPPELEEDVYVPDPDLLFTLRPSTVLSSEGIGFVDVQTNSYGLRGAELPGDRIPGELRVLCLGDSVTFGLALLDDQTMPVRLHEFLSESPELAGRSVHVVNGAVPGWSTVQGMRLFHELAWLEPDVVTFWLGMNDVQDVRGIPDSEQRGLPGAAGEAASALRDLRTFQLLTGILDSFRDVEEGTTRVSAEEFAAAVDELVRGEREGGPKTIFIRYPHQLPRKIAQLEHVIGRAREEGVEILAGSVAALTAILPARPGADLDGRVVEGPDGPELRLAGKLEVRPTLDLVETALAMVRRWYEEIEKRNALLPDSALSAEDLFGGPPRPSYFIDNVHLTEEGNRLAARAIGARILERMED